ncbi:MAG: LVIVD repeat-containing protein, partial [Actinomycetota bacterium]
MIGLLALALMMPLPTSAASESVATEGAGSPNMRHVAHLDYELRYQQTKSYGTDLEFATLQGRRFALAGTYRNGLQIIDVTRPSRPKIAAVYDCAIAQGDVQVFQRDGRTYATYTADDISSHTIRNSGCYRDLGLVDPDSGTPYGTFIVDVSDPYRPRTVGFAPLPAGSHNQTVHPSGRYLYNSNSDLANRSQPVPTGKIEVFDISNLANPRLVKTLDLGPGLNSHDITFSGDGKRAYSAAVTHTLVLDTSRPADPRIIGRINDQTVNIHHQSDPVTIDDPLVGKRRFLVVTDELAGAAGNGACPGGGLH